ncbi:c-type cytochrome [Rhizobium leucaenae]|uniref:Mono/diheme cytochrome c family protein n=1 Tax=Rhizobium leucaenae TaxID=29450 RepID=A0A7W7ELF5_9HYPH|nr:cytochrome c [Rhizobium leucaenae]MBB4569387.1 mono/diheme cytochrome c family protein [Rhizobium leucaenae]MBB6302841.1 mono/diheme cytochrome c family protein [Rhizobium leucaenae]
MTRRGTIAISAATIGLAAIASIVVWPSARAQVGDFALEQRGQYLVNIGDCVACHTEEGGQPFAGGRPLETPFGVIYTPNITPDPETGIGAWTGDQFYRAMHEGVAADGTHLYPAFPYPWFTKVKREDVDAIRAYLRTVAPVRNKRPDNQLVWPLNHSFSMTGWNTLFFSPGTFQPDGKQSAEWNRGAYLVEGLGHCGACHSPKNVLGAVKTSDRFKGSEIETWFAPDLTSNETAGLGRWSLDDIVSFLKTGHNSRTVAYGAMSEVVEDSTSKMTDADLRDIAVYLKTLPASPSSTGDDRAASKAGEAIYKDSCSACHQANGQGIPKLFPSLKGSSVVQSRDPLTMLRLILNGGRAASTTENPNNTAMPSFGWKLNDQQIAALSTYVRNAWGNHAAAVPASDVADVRSKVQAITTTK